MDVNKVDKSKEMQIADHLDKIFDLLGVERTESNEQTSLRVARMWNREIFRNGSNKLKLEDEVTMTTFDGSPSMGLIISKVPFHAFCEHHLLPFSGYVQIGYVPSKRIIGLSKRIIGLSKIPRIVDFWCHQPQLQEKLGKDILDTLKERLDPIFCVVRVVAEHSCVACRGIETDCETDTMCYSWRSILEDDPEERYLSEFMMRVGR